MHSSHGDRSCIVSDVVASGEPIALSGREGGYDESALGAREGKGYEDDVNVEDVDDDNDVAGEGCIIENAGR